MVVNRLPQILAERGLSIRELARQTGITYSTIWAVVQGERRSVQLEVLEAICLALATQPGDIYFIVSDELPLAAIPVRATSSEEKKVVPAGQDLKDSGIAMAADQNRRKGRSGDDWRSW